MKRWLAVLLIIIFVGLSLGSSTVESQTFDEIVHQEEGINALTKHTFLIDANNPPLIRELAMLPTVLRIGIPPRFIVILMGVALLVAVYKVTKDYFGSTQALLALFLLALEPTVLANSHYVTLDTGFSLFFFLAYISLLRLHKKYSVRALVVAGAAFGIAASSKMFAAPFFLGGALFMRHTWFSVRRFVLFSVCAAIVIWATYFFAFDTIIVPREDSGRLSSRLYAYAKAHNLPILESSLRFFETQKLPLGNYIAVIKNTLVRTQQPQKMFFLGSFYDHARWYFLPVNLLYKVPLPLWILFGFGLPVGSRFFVIPGLVIIATVSLSGSQPWIRYALPAIPFLVIVAAGSVKLLFTGFQKIIFVLLIFWYAFAAAQSFPHFISYANELAGPASLRFTKFMDSNLDWGQGLPDIRQFVSIAKPSMMRFSYFGRDNGDTYGLMSNFPYGSHIYENICAFHEIPLPYAGPAVTAISVSNWYYCGYYSDKRYALTGNTQVIGYSIFVYP